MRASTSLQGLVRAARATRTVKPARALAIRYASSSLRMPAMSPTMTEGGITSWKKNEGEAFAAGDVLLEVETDKATIDVEAQDDGVMGKIIVQAGSSKIPVGQVIAVLAEEGDDLAAIEVPKELGPEGSASSSPPETPKEDAKPAAPEPKEESAPAPTPKADEKKHEHQAFTHPKPLFPGVARLLGESGLSQDTITNLQGTGRGGMLTKGDVLKAMGAVKSAYGSAEKLVTDILGPSGKRASESKATAPSGTAEKKVEAPLDAARIRRLILGGMAKATQPATPIVQHVSTSLPFSSDAEFDAILSPYSTLLPPPQPSVPLPSASALASMGGSAAKPKDDISSLF